MFVPKSNIGFLRSSASGWGKVRYRGLAKNTNRAFAMLAMLNINNKWGRTLTGEVRPV